MPLRIKLHELGFTQPPTPIKIDNSAAKGIVTATVRQKRSKAMDMRFYCMKDRVKQKDFFVYWKPGSQNMGDYFTKHHPPHHHKEICATYLYMANTLLEINQKIVHKWANAMLASIHTFAVTPVHTVTIRQNRTVLQGCANVVCTYGQTQKYQNSNVVRRTGMVRGSLSVRKTARREDVPRTH